MYCKHLLIRSFAGFFALILIANTASSANYTPLQNLEQAKFRVHEMLTALEPHPRADYDKAYEHANKAKEFLEAAYKERKATEPSGGYTDRALDYIQDASYHLDEAIHDLNDNPKVETGIVAHAEAAQKAILKAIEALAA